MTTEATEIGLFAQEAVDPSELEPGTVYAILNDGGGLDIKDTDEWAEHPRRAEVSRKVLDAVSFIKYLQKHGTAYSEVWADTPNSTVTALIDTNQGADLPAGWDKHRLTLELVQTEPWKAWKAIDGGLMSQTQFAEFIEFRALDVAEPTSAELLELAQRFTATKSVEYESSEKIKSGEVHLVYKETVKARAGQTGSIDIPDRLRLYLRPYIGGPVYSVWARFRYRLDGAVLKLGVVIERPQAILDAAFADIVTEIRDGKPATEGKAAFGDSPAVLASPGYPGITQPIYFGRP